jgi:hypothetical protein
MNIRQSFGDRPGALIALERFLAGDANRVRQTCRTRARKRSSL